VTLRRYNYEEWLSDLTVVVRTGTCTQCEMIRNREREYFLFDFIPRNLTSSAAVEKYIAEALGVPTS
jgi:hypothetical protein